MQPLETNPDRDMIYGAVNESVLARVPREARRVLDLGCGNGALGQRIKEICRAEVVGVTFSPVEAAMAARVIDRVLVRDLDEFDPAEVGRFDCVICSHVLEHLQHPEKLLQRLRPQLEAGGRLIVALPNVLYWRQRLRFLSGRFEYTEGGLMDRTHLRFFDWNTAQELVRSSGYLLDERHVDGSFPLSRWLGPLGRSLERGSVACYPGLFGFQFVFCGRAEGDDAG